MEIHIRIGQLGNSQHLGAMDASEMIKAILAKTGWKQQQLAERLGVAQSQVSRAANGAEVSWRLGEAIKAVAIDVGVLTNETGTSNMTFLVAVRGTASVADDIAWSGESAKRVATLPFPVPTHCFGVEILANGVTLRARKGDLVIAGPQTDDLNSMIEQEAVLELSDGRYMIGTLVPATSEGLHSVIGPHGVLERAVKVASGAPYVATFAASRWKVDS